MGRSRFWFSISLVLAHGFHSSFVKYVCRHRRASFRLGISFSPSLVATRLGPGVHTLTWLLGELVFTTPMDDWWTEQVMLGLWNPA